MTDSHLVQLAKQGDPQAIAALLNRQLSAKGVTVKAVREEECLQVLLESSRALNKDVAIAGMQKRLVQLAPEGIETIRLQALQEGSFSPIWTYEFQLSDEPLPPHGSASEPPPLPAPPPPKLEARIGVGELVLLGFGLTLFFIFCRLLGFNFFAGIFLALIPATLAYNNGRSFWAWYAYGLNLYLPATLHASFLKGFNFYGIIAVFLGGVFVKNLSEEIGILLLIPNLIFGLIPAIIAASKRRNFINWYIYGISLFLVALFHSMLLKTNVLKTIKNRNLAGISFAGKDLAGANFQGSDLQGANFSQAKLIGVNFTRANLSRANFSEANLWGTSFDRADLGGANFNRASNRWQRADKPNLEKFLPWWIPVGLGLLVAQLLLWGLFFGSPLGLLVSGPIEMTREFWLARVPFVLSCYIGGTASLLVAIALTLSRKLNLAIALLFALALSAIASILRSLQLLLPNALAPNLLLISALSTVTLLAAVLQAARSLKQNQWKSYSTWSGIASVTSLWAILLLWGQGALAAFIAALQPGWGRGARFLTALLPGWGVNTSLLSGILFVATLIAWGALVGHLIGLVIERRSTTFRNANLAGAKFRNINFRNADFSNTDFHEIDWTGAKIKDSISPDGRALSRGH